MRVHSAISVLLFVSGCGNDSVASLQGAIGELVSVDGPTVIAPQPLRPPRVASCPGGRLPDVCGSWEGVQLTASKDYSPSSQSQDGEHCFCHPIAFQIPAAIPVVEGSAGTHTASFSYRDTDSHKMVSCRYSGDASRGHSKFALGGQSFLWDSCDDGSPVGANRHGDYFALSIGMGDLQGGSTRVLLSIGAPPNPTQEQEFFSDDPRIPNAVLHVPLGAAPAGQGFKLAVVEQVPIGTLMPNGGAPANSVGWGVDFTAIGTSGSFTFTPTATCPRIEIPYDKATAVSFAGTSAESRLRAYQITDLAGVQANVRSLQAITVERDVDPVNSTISFCTTHLTPYLGAVNGYDSASMTVHYGVPIQDQDKMGTGEVYTITATVNNSGTKDWGSDIFVGMHPVPSFAPFPNVPYLVGQGAGLHGQTDTFTGTITAPSAAGDYALELCAVQHSPPAADVFFGDCYFVIIHVRGEICNGMDDDGNHQIDEGNPGGGAYCAVPGLEGVCADGIVTCLGGSLQCPQVNFPTSEICNGKDDDCKNGPDDNLTRNCGTDVGACEFGTETCSGGNWGNCVGGIAPQPEIICDGIDEACNGNADESRTETCNGVDDNCNGIVDDVAGTGALCFDPTQQGICVLGSTTCDLTSQSVVCKHIDPAPEQCGLQLDLDCDGVVDNGTLTGGNNCGYMINTANIDDDLSVWTGDAVNGRSPDIFFSRGSLISGVGMCGLFNGTCGQQDILFKIGNGGCGNSGGEVDILYQSKQSEPFSTVATISEPSVIWSHCGYTYRWIWRFSSDQVAPTLVSFKVCNLPTDCMN